MEKRKLKQVDKHSDKHSIIQTIVELMNKVECVLESGLDKNYVLNETKKLLGDEVYIEII